MESERAPVNPNLEDLFRTALANAKPPAAPDTPSIVVNGSHNVISLGGHVYVRDRQSLLTTEAP